jgi:hypothetical protein
MRWRALTVGLVAIGLLACNRGGLPPEQVQAWVGRPAAELERAWGPATKEVTDAGQRVLIYEEVERTGSAEFSREVSPRSAGTGPPPPPPSTLGYSSYARSYLFWVDAAGTIVRTQIRRP